LIVEDDGTFAASMRVFLEQAELVTETARNGTEALVVAQSYRPDAVVLDLGLPGIDGFQVARQLSKLEPRPLLIAVTGRTAPLDEHEAERAGVDYFLTKPPDLQRLVQLIKGALPSI
jgi:two-component system CheB/CheR fusion protein